MRTIWAVVALALVACGGDEGVSADAALTDAALTDAAPADAAPTDVRLVDAQPDAAPDGAAPAHLVITPPSHDFGARCVDSLGCGLGDSADFQVTNMGGVASGPLAVAVAGDSFLVAASTCQAALAPGATCSVQVRIVFTSASAKVGTLTVRDTPNDEVSATLMATFLTCSSVFFTPTLADFGGTAAGTRSAPRRLTLQDNGCPRGTISTQLSGASASQFEITANTCEGASLSPASPTCSIDVVFAPTGTGGKSATLTAIINAGPVLQAGLTGTGL